MQRNPGRTLGKPELTFGSGLGLDSLASGCSGVVFAGTVLGLWILELWFVELWFLGL